MNYDDGVMNRHALTPLIAAIACIAGCLRVPPGIDGLDTGIEDIEDLGTESDLKPDVGAIDVAADTGPEGPAFVGVTAGSLHACAWTDEGRVACWGSNFTGQVDSSTPDSVVAPF